MIKLQPFEGAANRTAVVSIEKGQPTTYPVPYMLWRKSEKGSISMELSFREVFEKTRRFNMHAQPVRGDRTSPWMTAKKKALDASIKLIGESSYKAMAGSCTWINGVYWGRISESSGNLVKFHNAYNIGKIETDPAEMFIESSLIFPLLRGRDISKWHSSSELYIIVSQNPETRTGYDEQWMQNNVPKTLQYLNRFKDILAQRNGYKKYLEGEPFYSIYNVGPYTFAPYKIVWREQSSEFQCAVVSHGKVGQDFKTIIPDHKLMLVPFETKEEAHFVAACLNSSITRFIVKGYAIETSQSTHILTNVAIPKFDTSDSYHQDLSIFSQKCHDYVEAGIDIADVEERIDELTAKVWEITQEELQEIKDSLKEIE